jgi:predicted DNA-binding protein with PD1-like motif
MKKLIFILLTIFNILSFSRLYAQDEYISPRQPVAKGQAPAMKYKLLSNNNGVKTYALIFGKGDDVLSGITDFAELNHVTSAHLRAIGALSSAKLGFYDPTRKLYHLIPISNQCEVVSLLGDIALYNGKPVVHAHVSVSMSDGQVKGGHLFEAHVWPLLEVILTVEPATLTKKPDNDTGLLLIDPSI